MYPCVGIKVNFGNENIINDVCYLINGCKCKTKI